MPDDPLTHEQIDLILQRAFGGATGLIGYEQFRGGTVNQVYRVSVAGRLPLILRVAPSAAAAQPGDTRDLMRREAAIRPYFEPVKALLPEPLLFDFSHTAVDRDYMLQTFIDGDRWEYVARGLDRQTSLGLWRQFGDLLRRIHAVTGSAFGDPPPGEAFASWSDAILHRLQRARRALLDAGLGAEARLLDQVWEAARLGRAVLDEVRTPHLLHGDLWLYNLLIRDDGDGARIVGLLDPDRAWWGDPLADWTHFVLDWHAPDGFAPFRTAFQDSYGSVAGAPTPTPAAFRGAVYRAMHIAASLSWAAREHHDDMLARGRRELPRVVDRISGHPFGNGVPSRAHPQNRS